ncbi:MAG: hypothetical protein COY11_01550 [Candidatus Portnoybacteria bacterium CG_4_10_14_0_2_um_filter_44_20]|uniref:YgjP-like metallopeptidase domain-containing protein n=1 Tax=Candidatus Portnoybacteria bacterium CG_4_10_14_0_2_um_filter_44_20 TaxID=1974799 RepID=A0A2M7UJF0_9BACT|nr:MAG: hypothetical protein COY11_01550 [Candidatus Portnoybacteria bacterium CG_4_10_14_0_2_um_filter_44_20]
MDFTDINSTRSISKIRKLVGAVVRRGGILIFNYKILFLSQGLSDYIIVHELCHLGEFNHSRKFWNLVAKTVPDYLKIKSELKKTGISFD